MVVLDQPLLHQDGQNVRSRLAGALLAVAIVRLEGYRVVTQQLLHELVIDACHDDLVIGGTGV